MKENRLVLGILAALFVLVILACGLFMLLRVGVVQVESATASKIDICLIEEIELPSGKRATRELWINEYGSSGVVSADDSLTSADWDALNQISGQPVSDLDGSNIRLISSNKCQE